MSGVRTFAMLTVSAAQARRKILPRVAVFLEFTDHMVCRAPVRMWFGGPWCLDRPANDATPRQGTGR